MVSGQQKDAEIAAVKASLKNSEGVCVCVCVCMYVLFRTDLIL